MINKNYLSLSESYIFEKLKRDAASFRAGNPQCVLYDLSIGDVCGPLPECAADALAASSLEMKNKNTFRGYGPAEGYSDLREAICGYYRRRGVSLELDEVFVTDGTKPAVFDFLSLFSGVNSLVPEPTYPVFAEASLMHGFGVNRCFFDDGSPHTPENAHIPRDPIGAPYLIFLCSPNNPDGYALSRSELASWVDHAEKTGSLILFDAAYERFITSADVPHSVFELMGSRKLAVEFGSFSKFAGFTGLRCGWCVVPRELRVDNYSLNSLFRRALCTSSNGVSYPSQRAALGVLCEQGLSECSAFADYFRGNSRILADAFARISRGITGGENSPYLWVRTPRGVGGDEFAEILLRAAHVLVTPSSGFGRHDGEHFRVSCLCDRETAKNAAESVLNNAEKLLI